MSLDFFSNLLHMKCDFSDEEKERLVAHFRNGDLNQYYLIIIQKVLSKKTFTESNDKLITGLLSISTKLGLEKLNINSDADILDNACTIYKILMSIDITDIDNTEF